MRTKSWALITVITLCSFGKKWHGRDRYKFPQLVYFPAMPDSTHIVTDAGVELGRFLFYDPILSRDSSVSCASCHKQAFAFSDAPNKLSEVSGVKLQRNTPALFNLAWQRNLFWDGRSHSIENQVLHPLRDKNEMDLGWGEAAKRVSRSAFYRRKFRECFDNRIIDSNSISAAIAQFERTLISYRSKYDRVIVGRDTFTNDEAEGFILVNDMTKGGCLHCHTTDADALGSTFTFSNNGLDKTAHASEFADAGRGSVTGNPADNGKFKTPSLRNLVFTAPYMHDGRFETIEQIVDFYSEGVKYSPTISSEMEFVHNGGAHLTVVEKRKIIAFLLTLSDSAFVTDAAFSNPFNRAQKLR